MTANHSWAQGALPANHAMIFACNTHMQGEGFTLVELYQQYWDLVVPLHRFALIVPAINKITNKVRQ